jgi:hypothetical protein
LYSSRFAFILHIRKYHLSTLQNICTTHKLVLTNPTRNEATVDIPPNIVSPIDSGENMDTNEGLYMMENDLLDELPLVEIVQPPALNIPQEFSSLSLNSHLHNCKTYGYYRAVTLLICRAAYQTKNANDDDVPSPWLAAFITITRIVLLSKNEVHELLSTLLLFLNVVIRVCLVPLNKYPRMPLPKTKKDFHSMILNPTNTNSIKSILPMPFFEHSDETEHCIVSVMELVDMSMFMPIPKGQKEGVSLRHQSTVKSESFFEHRNKVPKCYREGKHSVPSVMAYIILWSDGWDPNRSNKSNHHPVWSVTGTIILVELGVEDNLYMTDTVLLGVGPGKKSHEVFFDMLVLEKCKTWEDADGIGLVINNSNDIVYLVLE